MPIELTTGDTFDGIDITILRGETPVDSDLVQTATAKITNASGVQSRTLSKHATDRGRFVYRFLSADYTTFPAGGAYKYQVLLNFVDGTQKVAPSPKGGVAQYKTLKVAGPLA